MNTRERIDEMCRQYGTTRNNMKRCDLAKWLIEHFHNAYLRKDAERIQQKLLEEGISTELRQTSDRKGCVLWEV